MAKQPWFLEQREQKAGFSKRSVAAAITVLGMMAVLIIQLVQLQVIEHEEYTTIADANRLNTEPAIPARGRIYSRNGIILAENKMTYQLLLTPAQVQDIIPTSWKLIQLANLSKDDALRFRKQLRRSSKHSPIVLKTRLSIEELNAVSAYFHQLPGIEIGKELSRIYPQKSVASHAIGYVALIDKKDLKEVDSEQYRGTQYIGKTGVEKNYETLLHGYVGQELIESNARRRKISTVEYDAPIAGADLYMTIDLPLQKLTKELFEDFEPSLNGAAVAIEPATGDVLALVNHPNFDPNLYATGISIQDLIELKQNENKPQFNRSVKGQYPPGSTLKPFVALAGLHYNEVDEKPEYCPGFYQLPNLKHKYRDWKRSGHGAMNLNQAIAQSCDIYFYELARKLGVDRMHAMLTQFHLGKRTGIDLIGESPGLMPNTRWKQRELKTPWYQGETLIAGIGQGFVKNTPLQLAHATATLANRGKVITPRLVNAIKFPNQPKRFLQSQHTHTIEIAEYHWQRVINGMIEVVHGRRGTAKKLSKDLMFIMAGKSGTAQVKSLAQKGDNYDHEKEELKHRDHALFIAFAPIYDPQIAVAVVVEHGGSGGKMAGPIAAKMIKSWLNRTQGYSQSNDDTSNSNNINNDMSENMFIINANDLHKHQHNHKRNNLPLPTHSISTDQLSPDQLSTHQPSTNQPSTNQLSTTVERSQSSEQNNAKLHAHAH